MWRSALPLCLPVAQPITRHHPEALPSLSSRGEVFFASSAWDDLLRFVIVGLDPSIGA